jgi:tetratricopeptide (TPR) repeat protein
MLDSWIRKGEGRTSVVFVHGILSSGETSWMHSTGVYWPELLAREADLQSAGIYVFTYKTGIFSGTYRLGDVVDALKEHMQLDGVLNNRHLIFVCHSMGGVVVRKFLVERAADLIEKKIKVGLFLIASPSLGSTYANWLAPIARLFGHTQADALRFEQTNAWLMDLDREFQNLKESRRLKMRGKELVEDTFIALKNIVTDQIVPPFSGARYFGEPYKVPDSDHFSIAKVENSMAEQHRLLLKFIFEPIDDYFEAHVPPVKKPPQDGGDSGEPFVAVPPRIARFTGRAEDLDRLAAIFNLKKSLDEPSLNRVAVHGLGGMGKTSLAIEYAHRFRHLYAGVCWCPSELRSGLLASLASLGAVLRVVEADQPDIEKAAKAALSALANEPAPWLLIYDNVPSPDDIADFLPASSSHILVTSRFSDWTEWAEELALDVLPLDEAVTLLQGRAGRSDEEGARSLAEALGRLPLALDHAASTCRRSQMRFADYAYKLEKLINTAPRGASYPRSVYATVHLAAAEAVKQCEAAELLLSLFAHCAPERIPMTLVDAAIPSQEERSAAVSALAEVSLIKHVAFEDGTNATMMHRLVQAATRMRIADLGLAESAVKNMTRLVEQAFPATSFDNPRLWPICSKLLPHALALRKYETTDRELLETRAKLLAAVASFLWGRASHAEGEVLQREAIKAAEAAHGADSLVVAGLLFSLNMHLNGRGRFTEAVNLGLRALTIWEMHPGSDALPILKAHADHLYRVGKFAEAEELYRDAIIRKERAFGAEHENVCPYIDALGLFLDHRLGRSAEAESLYRRCLSITGKALAEAGDTEGRGQSPCPLDSGDPRPRDVIVGFYAVRLAQFLQSAGRYAESENLYREAIAIYENHKDAHYQSIQDTKNQLADLYMAVGRLEDSETICRDLVATSERDRGPDHPITAYYKVSLANALAANRWADADPLYRDAMRISEQHDGAESSKHAVFLSSLAVDLARFGRLSQAQDFCAKAVTILCKIGGDPHNMATAVRRLAGILLKAERFDEAFEQGTVALAIYDEIYGPFMGATKDAASMCARALDSLGRAEEAIALRARYRVVDNRQV